MDFWHTCDESTTDDCVGKYGRILCKNFDLT